MPGKRGSILAFVVAVASAGTLAASLQAFAVPEADLVRRLESEVRPYLATHARSGLLDVPGARLSWRAVEVENPLGRVVFLPGAAASHAFYEELLYDLAREGLDVYALDLRGSGLSTGSVRYEAPDGRISYLTHAESFDTLVSDLDAFLANVVKAPADAPPSIVGSSSGAVVAGLYAARNPEKIARVALVNPLFELTFGHRNPAGSFAFLAGQVLLGKALLPAPVPAFDARTWVADDSQTRSAPRRAAMGRSLSSHPELAAGGVTTLWAKALSDASFRLEAESYKVRAPVLMIQSHSDLISSTRTQDDQCRRLRACTKVTFEEAGHWSLLERDEVRDAALEHLLRFFNLRTVSSNDALARRTKKAL